MGNSHLGVVANYRSISCREALTFETTKGEFGLPWVKYRSIPERLGRLLHGIYDIYEAFGGGMGEMIDRVRKRVASATPMRECSPLVTCPTPSGEDFGSIAW